MDEVLGYMGGEGSKCQATPIIAPRLVHIETDYRGEVRQQETE